VSLLCHVLDQEGSYPTRYWRLAKVMETEGPAIIQAFAVEDGAPAIEVPIWNSWPDNSLPMTPWPYAWMQRAMCQGTDGVDGTTGFGLGGGSYYFPPGNGPHTLWCGEVLPSQGITGVGMLSGTNHMGPLRLTWVNEEIPWGVEPDPEPEPGTGPCSPSDMEVIKGTLLNISNTLSIIKVYLSDLAGHLGTEGH